MIYMVIHNGVTIDCCKNLEEARELARAVSSRHHIFNHAIIRSLPLRG